VRLAEFSAAANGLDAVARGGGQRSRRRERVWSPRRASLPAQPAVTGVLQALRAGAAMREVRWYWAERDESAGQLRCQALIQRQVRVGQAYSRFLTTCRAAGLARVFLPRFQRWLAPREPIVAGSRNTGLPRSNGATAFSLADTSSPRVYLRQLRLDRLRHASLSAAFLASPAVGWCDDLEEREPLSGA
jgi:hypothetical protein